MVDGTGLENQQINVSQVRILSLPPSVCVSIGVFLLVDVEVGGVGGVDAEVHKGNHFIVG